MRIHPKLGFMAQEKWDSLQLGYLGRVDGGFRLQMSQLKNADLDRLDILLQKRLEPTNSQGASTT